MVSRGSWPVDAVQEALVIAVGRPEIGTSLRCEIAWALRDAARELELRRFLAERHVCRVVAPLLDARLSEAEVQARARGADRSGLLSPEEMAGIVARETAWWLRLHIQLDGEETSDAAP